MDLIYSCIGGVGLSFSIIFILQKYPGKPFDYSKDDSNSSEFTNQTNLLTGEEVQKSEKSVAEIIKSLDEDEFIAKSVKLRTTLGISEKDLRTAVKMTKNDVASGINPIDQLDIFYILEWILLILAIIFCLYLTNNASKGELFSRLEGLFPLEFDALGLSTRAK